MATSNRSFVDVLKPVMVMVFAQAILSGVNVFYKLAVVDGMSMRILIAYRFVFATGIVLPLALVMERKGRPKLTWMIAFQGFLAGLFGGSLGQNLYIASLSLTSATFAAAMANLIPAVTFILAITFRMEKLSLKTWTGNAKAVGTLLGIGGAMVLTFYKGFEVQLWSIKITLIEQSHHHTSLSKADQILGTSLALASCLSYAIWYIVQAKMSEKYPCKFSSTALMCGSSSVQSTIYAMCLERDWSAWKLGWNIRLASAAYTGIVASGLVFVVTVWCVSLKGPFFVSMFNPLTLVFVALLGSLILDEKLHFGTILGSILIIIGLYAVFMGKENEEKKKSTQDSSSKSSREPQPTTNSGSMQIVVVSPGSNNH